MERVLTCLLGTFFGLMVFTHCSSLTRSRNEAALQKIKKIAVAGFSVVGPTSAKIGLKLGNGKAEAHAGGSMITKTSTETNEMYDDLVRSFGKNTSWKVTAQQPLKTHPAYTKAYDATMKGWQNKMPVGEGRQQYNVDGIIDKDGLRLLGKEGRNELMKGLGVDAIVTATVDVSLNGSTVMGIGNRYPQARLSFYLYTYDSTSPDWFEGNIEGDVSKTSVGKTAFIDENLLAQLARESARTAFARIGQTVQ